MPMPRKPATPKPWQPPAGLKVEVMVGRGDVSFRAEAPVGEALPVARLLVAMARQIAQDAPDVLPHAETIGGAVLPYFDDDYADQSKRVGFRPKA